MRGDFYVLLQEGRSRRRVWDISDEKKVLPVGIFDNRRRRERIACFGKLFLRRKLAVSGVFAMRNHKCRFYTIVRQTGRKQPKRHSGKMELGKSVLWDKRRNAKRSESGKVCAGSSAEKEKNGEGKERRRGIKTAKQKRVRLDSLSF